MSRNKLVPQRFLTLMNRMTNERVKPPVVKEPEVEEETFGPRYKPERLDELCKNTKFDRDEIRLIYQGFKQECPTGLVDEDAFKLIFAQFFPQGDASQYAHYVFNTMKQYGHNGCLTFEQFLQVLSSLSRGSVTEKVQWIFGLYDLNGDGFISRTEMLRVVSAIYDMLGHWTQPQVNEHTAREHVDKIFSLIDADHDGLVSFEEFLEWCQRDESRTRSLFMLDTVL